jgi:hypothetical protein
VEPYRISAPRTHAAPRASDAVARSGTVEDRLILAMVFAAGALGVAAAVADPTRTTAGPVGMLLVLFATASFVRGLVRQRAWKRSEASQASRPDDER